jgi:lipopolysaccharide transport system ATP-binding protein
MSNDIAISVKNVSKAYRIWRDPSARLKAPLWEAWQKLRAKSGELGARSYELLAKESYLKKLGAKSYEPRATNSEQSAPSSKLPAPSSVPPSSSKYYKDFYALNGVSFTVKKGEAVGIIGRNGSGKSTLLQMIAGTLTPTSGSIKVNGRVAALLELGSGFNPEFNGRENVYLNASVLGLNRDEIDARYNEITAFADIGDFIDQPVKTYSSGMTMRLAFAVIAHVDADILIVDEALAVGDAFFVQKCMRFIRQFQQKGTLLLVTHDTSAVQSLCQNAVWLHHGECRGQGSSKSITESYLEATYAEQQGVKFFADNENINSKPETPRQAEYIVDQRAAFINKSNLRNDLEVFDFNPNSSGFGAGGAIIEKVQLLDANTGNKLSYGVGGEEVILGITVLAKIDIESPIIGFYLKNALGQPLFGDNTYLSYRDKPISMEKGSRVIGNFKFQIPYLPAGNYMFAVACASGTQENHVQHHWLHEALSFCAQSTHSVGGLIGIPMREVSLIKEAL